VRFCHRVTTFTFSQAQPFARDHGMSIQCTMPVPPCAVEVERFPEVRFGNCPIGTELQEIALGPDGRLRNCTLHGSAIVDVDVGDPSVDLVEVVNAPARMEYRSKRPEFCAGCVHEHTCGGGCGAASAWVLGDARAYPDPLVWQHVDDPFAERIASARGKNKRSLEVIA
jgi:radical SAM protein with 4Fe4S-binding SPASM domain